MLMVCALIWDETLRDFSHEKILPWDFLEFVGNSIGMPV